MKQKIFLLFSILAISVLANSCLFLEGINGNGKVAEQSRKVSKFDEIKVSRGLNVYIIQGNAQEVVVRTDENLLGIIETKVKNNVLEITASKNIRRAKSKKVFVTVPEISRISASAGSNVYSENFLELKYLKLTGSAGSNLKIKLKTENVEVSASAGSNIMLEGTTKSISVKASAGSNVKAEELVAESGDLTAGSGANIWITTKESFSGKSSSGGNIFYYGNPALVKSEKSSGGNINKK